MVVVRITFIMEVESFLLLQVKEIEQEVYVEPETVQQQDMKQTAAVDLSKRLKDLRSANDAASLKGNCLSFFLVVLSLVCSCLFHNTYTSFKSDVVMLSLLHKINNEFLMKKCQVSLYYGLSIIMTM